MHCFYYLMHSSINTLFDICMHVQYRSLNHIFLCVFAIIENGEIVGFVGTLTKSHSFVSMLSNHDILITLDALMVVLLSFRFIQVYSCSFEAQSTHPYLLGSLASDQVEACGKLRKQNGVF